MRRIAVLSVTTAALACLPGCPEPVGGCQYGRAGGEEGTVEVVSLSPPTRDLGQEFILVEVRGLFTRTVPVPVADYAQCFEAQGWTVGSTIPARVIYGGPCPPMDQLGECPPMS